jgi:hypothetical protein
LNACGKVGGLAQREQLAFFVAADFTNDDQTGVNANADLQSPRPYEERARVRGIVKLSNYTTLTPTLSLKGRGRKRGRSHEGRGDLFV